MRRQFCCGMVSASRRDMHVAVMVCLSVHDSLALFPRVAAVAAAVLAFFALRPGKGWLRRSAAAVAALEDGSNDESLKDSPAVGASVIGSHPSGSGAAGDSATGAGTNQQLGRMPLSGMGSPAALTPGQTASWSSRWDAPTQLPSQPRLLSGFKVRSTSLPAAPTPLMTTSCCPSYLPNWLLARPWPPPPSQHCWRLAVEVAAAGRPSCAPTCGCGRCSGRR